MEQIEQKLMIGRNSITGITLTDLNAVQFIRIGIEIEARQ